MAPVRWAYAAATTTVATVLSLVAGCSAATTGADSRGTVDPSLQTSATRSPGEGKPPVDATATANIRRRKPTAAELRTARSTPVEDPYYPGTSNPEVDALHYQLRLDWRGSTLTGDTTLTFRAARRTGHIRLDLSRALHVSEVRLDGSLIGYRQSRKGLLMDTHRLRVDTVHVVEIVYAGTPHSTPAPSSRSDATEGLGWNVDSRGSVHTFQEPYGAFTWYPVNDHPSDKALYDAAITTHGRDVAVFNGELAKRRRTGHKTVSRWHLEEPAASYLVTLAIGPYRRTVAITRSGMRISYWLQPRDAALLPALEAEGAKAFRWLEAHAGPYPFSTLGVVVVGGDSAMETQTMITMSRSAVGRSDAVLEHEMAHEWYGDSVTPLDWRALWLNEGWAMYMQQWYERNQGRPVYAGGILHWRRLDQQSRNRSGPPGDYNPDNFADLNVYLGPAMMLDAIRMRVGNRAFRSIAKAWPADHASATVDRRTFTRWLRRQTDVRFATLLHRWLDSDRTPAPAGR